MPHNRKRPSYLDLPHLYDGSRLEPAEDDRTAPGVWLSSVPTPPKRSLARLVVLVGDRTGRRFVLSSETLIGRTRDAAILLTDPSASRKHAVIRPRDEGGFELEDLKSHNGTLVNGKPIELCTLKFGDRIQIGSHIMMFTHHDPLADQILMRQRLEAIGRMGAGIAHDFNNLLGVIVASLDFLDGLPEDRRPQDREVLACHEDIRQSATRATELTRRLLVYSREDRAEHTAVDTSILCHEVTKLLRRTIDQSIEIKTDIVSDLVVQGHNGELHQVLMNLCLNARDAMPKGGQLTVSAKIASKQQLSKCSLIDHGPCVALTVSDTGRGMDEETRQHLFEPFFTTKQQGSGVGLGLATVFEIVSAHAGDVVVDSVPNEGTMFTVFLPSSDQGELSNHLRMTISSDGLVIDPRDRQGDRKILLVDDEALIRRSIGRLLLQAGYTVDYASDGEEALVLVEHEKEELDLIILDIDMPRLDGVSALEKIRKITPYIAVICISGHHDEATRERLHELNVLAFIEKPCEAHRLLELVDLCFKPD